MEAFWEKLYDWMILGLKAFVVLFVIKVIFLIFGYQLPLPYIDDIFFFILRKIGDIIPGLRIDGL
ncbi:MAG: hypothetical protein KDD70_00170 [Bdellovibrionales bacterium]|nr:hypothetical protein [Bdellovibrionales bacterium]